MITEQQAMEYELGRVSFLMSIWFAISTKSFINHCKRKYRLYRDFYEKCESENLIEQKQAEMFIIVNKNTKQ